MLILFFLLILITENNSDNSGNSIEIILKKLSNGNNEYSPYTFNFTLDNNTLIKYPSIFDTTQTYILLQEENEVLENIINNNYFNCINYNSTVFKDLSKCEISIRNETTFYYFKTKEKISDKSILGIIGLSNINKNKSIIIGDNSENYYSSLNILQKDRNFSNKIINFIQKEDDEAIIKFGDIDNQFKKEHSRTCKCNGKYWSCELSSLKIGGNEIYTSQATESAIFSISDEYIIAPSKQGNITLEYYKNKIRELFGIDCYIKFGKYNYSNFTCNYFNYEDLPDLSFVMKGGIQIMALSIDLFKIIKDYKLELKIKYNKNNINSKDNWYLGEPVVKNYNFLLNYTNEKNEYLVIIPTSLNGFILIIVACVGGFLFLFIFLTIIFCVSKNDKKTTKRRSYFSNWRIGKRNSDIFFMAKNSYIKEKVEENEEEDEKSENSENSENNEDKSKSDNNSDNKSDSKSGSKSGSSNSNSDSDSEHNDDEEKKLDNENEENNNINININNSNNINNVENNLHVNNINNINNVENINNIDNNNKNNNNIFENLLINTDINNNNNNNKHNYNNNGKMSINTNNKDDSIHVELSINNYDEYNDEEKDSFIQNNK